MWDKNYIYRNAVSPMQRANIFATFREYLSLVNSLGDILAHHQINGLAELSRLKYRNGFPSPWRISQATDEETSHFHDFINDKQSEAVDKQGYICLNYTSPKHQDENTNILAVPSSYDIFCGGHALPCRIERYVVATQKNETLNDLKLVVGGKYTITYQGHGKDDDVIAQTTLMNALQDDNFEKNLMITLDEISLFPDDISKDKFDEVQKAEVEALATASFSPIENILLDALSLMAEETNKIIKIIMGRRVGSGYLAQAEKEGLLPSAAAVQDYLNIRHLLHHQWDTLDGIGKFNETEVIKNASVRQRFLDSYARLCDKPLIERVQSYKQAADCFLPLVMVLNDNILIRDKDESDSKFLERLRDFVNTQNEKTVFVMTNYTDEPNKQSLIEAIQKSYDCVTFMDKSSDKDAMARLNNLMKQYTERRQFLDIFQEIEYSISQHCLYLGKNYTPVVAWDFFRRSNIISAEEAKNWNTYKKLRNDLSHRYMDHDLNSKIAEIMPQFIQDALNLKTYIEQRAPKVHLIGDNIYRATHSNGLVVDIDFAQRRVLSITDARGQTTKPVYKSAPDTQRKHIYTEEYANGVSITMAGTKIIGCHLNSGITLNMDRRNIRYADGIHLYFDNPERIYLTSKDSEKIIMNNEFEVIKYINAGKEINFWNNERSILRSGHMILIGAQGRLSEDEWVNKQKSKIICSYQKTDEGLSFQYNDGTRIEIMPSEIKIFHHDLELTYENRKKFAESYNQIDGNALLSAKSHTY